MPLRPSGYAEAVRQFQHQFAIWRALRRKALHWYYWAVPGVMFAETTLRRGVTLKHFNPPKLSEWLPLENARAVKLDAGCGDGRWVIKQALLHPDVHFVALDRDETCVLQTLWRALEAFRIDPLEMRRMPNLTVLLAELRYLDLLFPAESLDEIQINFPSPKKSAPTASMHLGAIAGAEGPFKSDQQIRRFHNVLRPDGALRIVTDGVQAAQWALKPFVAAAGRASPAPPLFTSRLPYPYFTRSSQGAAGVKLWDACDLYDGSQFAATAETCNASARVHIRSFDLTSAPPGRGEGGAGAAEGKDAAPPPMVVEDEQRVQVPDLFEDSHEVQLAARQQSAAWKEMQNLLHEYEERLFRCTQPAGTEGQNGGEGQKMFAEAAEQASDPAGFSLRSAVAAPRAAGLVAPKAVAASASAAAAAAAGGVAGVVGVPSIHPTTVPPAYAEVQHTRPFVKSVPNEFMRSRRELILIHLIRSRDLNANCRLAPGPLEEARGRVRKTQAGAFRRHTRRGRLQMAAREWAAGEAGRAVAWTDFRRRLREPRPTPEAAIAPRH